MTPTHPPAPHRVRDGFTGNSAREDKENDDGKKRT